MRIFSDRLKVWLLGIGIGCVVAVMGNGMKPEGTPVPLGNASEYVVVIAPEADEVTRFSAGLLAESARRLFGGDWPVVNETPAGKRAIRLDTDALLPEQSYELRLDGDDLVIAGGVRGPIYGVLALLQEDWGIRWYDKREGVIDPAAAEFAVVPRRYATPFEIREPLYLDAWGDTPTGREWTGFNRLQNLSWYDLVDPRYGGGLANPHYFVHTYSTLIPAEQYFDSHPEYFPLIDGKRFRSTPTKGQLCYSNPGVIDAMVATLTQVIQENPGNRIFAVSANDNTFIACECPDCTELIAREGYGGAELHVANQVARQLALIQPDVRITTLAYVASQTPPATLRPEPNVVMLYAPIRERLGNPIMYHPWAEDEKIQREMAGWRERNARMYVWDYTDNGTCNPLPTPSPSFDIVAENMRFWAENGVTGVFLEGAEYTHASLGELKSWLFSQLMWNPYWSCDALIEDFVTGFYGVAAAEMREYVAIQREVWQRLRRQGQAGEALLFDRERCERMEALLEQALEKAGDDPALRAKLQREQIPLLTVRLNAFPDRNNPEEYEAKLARFRQCVTELGLVNLGLNAPAEPLIARWEKRLEEARSGSEFPLFCADSLVLTEADYWGSEKKTDTDTVRGHAARYPGGTENWGLQWRISDLVSQAEPGRVYLARVRVKPEFLRPHQPGEYYCQLGLYRFGYDGTQNSVLLIEEESLTDSAYRWRDFARVRVNSPATDGYLFAIVNQPIGADEALWFDYLEFIPVDALEDPASADRLPLLEI